MKYKILVQFLVAIFACSPSVSSDNMFEYKYECYKCDACTKVNEDGTGRCFASTGCFMYMPGDGGAAPFRGCMDVDSPCSNRRQDSTGTCHICHTNLCNDRPVEVHPKIKEPSPSPSPPPPPPSPSPSPFPLSSPSPSPSPLLSPSPQPQPQPQPSSPSPSPSPPLQSAPSPPFPFQPPAPGALSDSRSTNCTTTPLSPPFGPDPTVTPDPDPNFSDSDPNSDPGDSLDLPRDSSPSVGAQDDADPQDRMQLDDKGETEDPDCYKESKEQVGPAHPDLESIGPRESDATGDLDNRDREPGPRPGIQTNLLEDKTAYGDMGWEREKEQGQYDRGRDGYGSSYPPRLTDNSLFEPHQKNEPADGQDARPAPGPFPDQMPDPDSISRTGKAKHEMPTFMHGSRNKVEARRSLKLFPKKAASVAGRPILDAAALVLTLALALAPSPYVL